MRRRKSSELLSALECGRLAVGFDAARSFFAKRRAGAEIVERLKALNFADEFHGGSAADDRRWSSEEWREILRLADEVARSDS